MPKRVNKSRPISFRVPVESYSFVASRAEASGLSIGAYALRCVMEHEDRNIRAAVHRVQEPFTGEVVAAPDWRDRQLPRGDRMEEISTESDEIEVDGVPIPGPVPESATIEAFSSTESGILPEIPDSAPEPELSTDSRQERARALMEAANEDVAAARRARFNRLREEL